MPYYKLALLGFGNVGQSLAVLLEDKRDELKSKDNIDFSITGISTGKHGAALNQHGLDSDHAVKVIRAGESLDSLSIEEKPKDSFDFIRRTNADVLFENTPVNYENGQPAVDHLKLALDLGMNAITANKGPVVHAYKELTEIAEAKGRKFYFESTVMDGAPIFSLFRSALPGAQLLSFKGILNSTTNLILTRMEGGEEFDQAVAYAQEIGIAETDPSGDVDGWDAAVKVAALVTVLMGTPLKPKEVERSGIRDISSQDIKHAQEQGQRWKLVCSAVRDNGKVKASVAPQLVAPT
jgi:homoserine dehydrogenase